MTYELRAIVTDEIPTVTSVVRTWFSKAGDEQPVEKAFILGEKLTDDNALQMIAVALDQTILKEEQEKKPAPKKRRSKKAETEETE